jgi:hypothetical protein
LAKHAKFLPPQQIVGYGDEYEGFMALMVWIYAMSSIWLSMGSGTAAGLGLHSEMDIKAI